MEVTIPDEAFLSLSGLKMRILDELSFINPYLPFSVLIPLADDLSRLVGKFDPEQFNRTISDLIENTNLSNVPEDEINNYCQDHPLVVGFTVKEVLKNWDHQEAERFLKDVYGSK